MLAVAGAQPPPLPVLELQDSVCFEFKYQTHDPKVRGAACLMLDELRPGHGLRNETWRCFWVDKPAEARALAEALKDSEAVDRVTRKLATLG